MYVLESSPSQIELNSPLNFSLPSAESIGNGNFTLRNFLLRKKPLTLSSSSPLRFTRRSEYLTALNRLRCSGSPLKGSPCAPHPNPTQKFSSSEVVGCLNFEGKFLLSGLRLSAMLSSIFELLKTTRGIFDDGMAHSFIVLCT